MGADTHTATAGLPDVAQAATEMDAHAQHLDQQAATHADRAATIRAHARKQAEELVRQAQDAAAEHVAGEDLKAVPEQDFATRLRAQAEYWRGLASKQRAEAGVPAPQTPPSGRALGAQATIPWVDPKGVGWDLSLGYADSSGQRWHYSNRVGPCTKNRHPGEWPLMSHDDFGLIDVPFCESPPLRPAEEAEQTGQFLPIRISLACRDGKHELCQDPHGDRPDGCLCPCPPAGLDQVAKTQAEAVSES